MTMESRIKDLVASLPREHAREIYRGFSGEHTQNPYDTGYSADCHRCVAERVLVAALWGMVKELKGDSMALAHGEAHNVHIVGWPDTD